MVQEKLEIPLHDRSLVQVSRTDSGTLYIEVYAPGHARDGHGMILRGSTLLSDTDRRALLRLLTTGANCSKRVQTATEIASENSLSGNRCNFAKSLTRKVT